MIDNRFYDTYDEREVLSDDEREAWEAEMQAEINAEWDAMYAHDAWVREQESRQQPEGPIDLDAIPF